MRKLNRHSATQSAPSPARLGEEARRAQLVEVTIDCLAELGFVGTTLMQIARRAGVSPGLVAHYFGDKDGVLAAAFRSLVRRLSEEVRIRLESTAAPRERIQALIDANLAPELCNPRTGRAWLAFWGQVLQVDIFRRIQTAYQRRMLSNLRNALKQLMPAQEAQVLAAMIAAMIDGVWLRAALSGWREADSDTARAMVTAFVDERLKGSTTAGDAGGKSSLASRAHSRAAPATGRRLASLNPATGELLGHVDIAGPEQVDAAVLAAREAQPGWAALGAAERARILRRAAEILRERNDELAALETRDTGKPIQETRVVDVISGAECLEYFAALAQSAAGEHIDLGPQAFGYTRREPLGVVAGIGAWNYPLQIACWKSAPALAFGNAMIFKPASLTPLTAAELEKAYLEAGLPSGIFQVVQGHSETGRLLTRHPEIRKISLTGSVGTGKAVMTDASATLKAVTLELGGKSPLIVFEDAKLDQAVSGALLANFYSAGEVCSNATRVFVHRSVRKEFLRRLVERVSVMRIGDPMDPATQVGSLISGEHMENVLGYIARGRAEGARVIVGGNRRTEGALAKGFFVEPTVFDGCGDDMSIVREEIFGPVMSVLEFEDEWEVVRRANATEYGLSAGIFTNDLNRAHRVIALLEAGTCWINHFNVTPIELPFGGVKLSGLGRENGRAAMEHYTQLKSVYVAKGDIDAPY